jgi:hypothetical protein
MQKHMLTLGAMLMVAVVASVGWSTSPAFAQRARVPQTGQTQCWDAAGNPILCDGTGQDGDIQAGVAWPTPRFTDRGNGTVRDNLTGLIWLQNANCFGDRTWAQALTDANALASGSCGLTDRSEAGDWRLPNIKELQSLIDFSQPLGPALADGHPFSRVVDGFYWPSTTRADALAYAWTIALGSTDAINRSFGKGTAFDVWPVRGGD